MNDAEHIRQLRPRVQAALARGDGSWLTRLLACWWLRLTDTPKYR